MTNMRSEHVSEPAPPVGDARLIWNPVAGREVAATMQRSGLPDEGVTQVVQQAATILGKGIDPDSTGAEARTGLVVGYVQSGKTLSFTTAIALAHDNGFRLVVLLTGTKTNLHGQTTKRIRRDLDTDRQASPWLVLSNPDSSSSSAEDLAAALRAGPLGDSNNPFLDGLRRPRTALLTVMKNTNRIDKVADLLKGLPARGIDPNDLSVLIVDDEADQAGLNTKAAADDEEEPSATYRAIRDLRAALPRHTYLEYTATPQAPLLLNVLDTLAPDYVEVLTPGKGYTGGELFFVEERDRFVETIPEAEAAECLSDEPDGPPETLMKSIASFTLAGMLMSSAREASPASMLVHPSHTKETHERFARWVRAILESWTDMLDEGGVAADELANRYFAPAYRDLTGNDLDEQYQKIVAALPHIMPLIQTRVVNSAGATREIKFNNHRFWILVGGNKLDRGYTVEGLVTTYMPRGIGGGQADTIQQRARFFGYKAAYADLCRAWLTDESAHQYTRYVEHETHLRNSLKDMGATRQSLKEWRRHMLFDPRMRPCRAGVIGMPYVRERVAGGSYRRMEHILGDEAQAAENRERLEAFLAKHGSERGPDPRDPRSDHRTTTFTLPLRALVEDLLVPWQHNYADTAVLNAIELLLQARLDENPGLTARTFYMRDGLRRERGRRGQFVVNNLMEGRRSGQQPQDSFPGDLAFYAEEDDVVSVQIHRVDVKGDGPAGQKDVPALAIRVPRRMAADLLLGV